MNTDPEKAAPGEPVRVRAGARDLAHREVGSHSQARAHGGMVVPVLVGGPRHQNLAERR
jgi:hypothetical protein